MLTEVPNEPTGFIKLISTMSGDGDELYLKPGDDMVIAFEGLMSLRTKIVAPG